VRIADFDADNLFGCRQAQRPSGFGAAVLPVHEAAGDTTTAFSRVLGTRTVTFKPAGAALADNETGSQWNAYGECTAGSPQSQKLQRIVPQPGLWFAWAEFYLNTQLYSPTARRLNGK
jgi:Protein of unknown function (DUF3179)